MRERMKKLPLVLQKQVIIRFGAFLLSLTFLVFMLLLYGDIYFSLTLAALGLFFGISAMSMLIKLSDGKYVVIEGKCNKVEWTAFRKRAKMLYLNCKPQVKVCNRQKLRNFEIGDTVILYVSENTPVYEAEGYQLLSGYLAIEFWKGNDENDDE